MPSTYKDIKRLTGFSLSTISKYFNGGNVRPTTQKAIEEAAAELNFRMNDFARGLKSRKSMAVGLLVPKLNSMFATTVMGHVGHLLRQKGYSSIVYDSDHGKTTEKEAINFLINKMVDGIIAIPFDPSGSQFEPARARDIPIVLIDMKTTSFETDAVLIDNFAAGQMAAEYLLAQGHTCATVIFGPYDSYSMFQRQKGFVDTFSKRSSYVSAHAIETFYTIQNGYKAAKELLAGFHDCTAIFCTNYELTIGAYAAMNELQLRCPTDISFIGFDNMDLVRVIRPSLTLIEQPMERLAGIATDLLLKRLENDCVGEYETVLLDTKLVKGDSVADIRKR